jgi:CDP-diacylglycerol--serine O-phosphatidyltransferase
MKKEFRISKLIPSMVTLTGICVGLTAIKFALDGKFERAVAFVLIATILDVLDGKFARALKAVSEFGGQLDSLSDFINFGFVPAFILYLWNTNQISRFGWAGVLFYTMCCAIRLARFNVESDNENKPAWHIRFFKGVPSPAGALACLGPMILTFAIDDKLISLNKYFEFIKNPYFLIYYCCFIGVLMASRIPTYSVKKLAIKRDYISLLFIVFSIFIILAFIQPWLTVIFAGIIYFSLLPISVIHFLKLSKKT